MRMTSEDFITLLHRSINRYEDKTEKINYKPLILLMHKRENELFEKLAEKYHIQFTHIITCETQKQIAGIFKSFPKDVHYFISNSVMNDDVYQLYLDCGLDEENLYTGPTKDAYFDLYEKRNVIYENANEIAKVFDLLADEKSKQVLLRILTRLCMQYQYHYYYEPEDFQQYFPDTFRFSDHEIYLDAGVCDGQNIFEFIQHTGGNYQHIYGFEPDMDNYKMAEKNLYLLKNCQFLHKALYKEIQTMAFMSSHSTGKRGNAHLQENGDDNIQTYYGDALEHVPTFIKMDIEGAEAEALEGLQRTIKKNKPKLAVCIYHKQEDFWKIPLYIHHLNPFYQFIIRNHMKLFDLIETVCYAY